MQDEFAQYWQTVAATFYNVPSVIGYELINEPFFGDVFADPMVATPGYADQYNLQPMYQR
jgi:endoglycosylceramidase